MRPLFIVVKKEIKIALRERLVMAFGLIIFLLLAVALFTGYVSYQQQRSTIELVKEEKRTQWLNQPEKHPHIAAHYGTFIFKPKTILSMFDFGLDTYTGTSIYLEAHHPHDFMFRPAQQYSSMIRFGELSAALVLKVFLPLLIIFMTFSAITRERERGTLKLLLSQGMSFGTLVWGKIIANGLLIIAVLLPLLLGMLLAITSGLKSETIPDVSARTALLLVLYGAYLFLFVLLSVWISLRSKSGKNALLTLLACWMFLTILMPKAMANISESLYPLPSMREFREQIKEDVNNGLDGKTSKQDRYDLLLDQTLEEHGVDSVQQLPFNFGAKSMQASEEYSDKVHDHHMLQLRQTFEQQNNISKYTSFINPYQAIHQLSMALSGTDMHTSIHFDGYVQHYRRYLIKKMNKDMEENTRYGEFFEYKAGKDLWKEVEDFHYQTPTALQILRNYHVELLALLSWLVIMIFGLRFSYQKTVGINV